MSTRCNFDLEKKKKKTKQNKTQKQKQNKKQNPTKGATITFQSILI